MTGPGLLHALSVFLQDYEERVQRREREPMTLASRRLLYEFIEYGVAAEAIEDTIVCDAPTCQPGHPYTADLDEDAA